MILRQFTTYIIVGVVSALVDIGLMQLLMFLGVHYLVAATFGFIAGLLVNFLLHSRVTFKEAYSHAVLARFIAGFLVNCALTLIVVQVFHEWLAMPVLGKIVSLPLVAVNGFLLSKYWIYKSPKAPVSALEDIDR